MTHIYTVYKSLSSEQKIYTDWKWRDGKNTPCKCMWKKAVVAILTLDKIGFKIKVITRDKEGHYIILKRIFQQEAITLENIYAPNIGTPKYI